MIPNGKALAIVALVVGCVTSLAVTTAEARDIEVKQAAPMRIKQQPSPPTIHEAAPMRVQRNGEQPRQMNNQSAPRQVEAGQMRIKQVGPMLSDQERARIRQQNAAAQDAWVRERARRRDPNGRGMNSAQIEAQGMINRRMTEFNNPGVTYNGR